MSQKKMTRKQYRQILRREHARLVALTGIDAKFSLDMTKPEECTIDVLKGLIRELRGRLAQKGIEHRTPEQIKADEAETEKLLDEIEELAVRMGYDPKAKRAAAVGKSVPWLKRFVADCHTWLATQAKSAERDAAHAQFLAERDAARQLPGTATPRQVDYIMDLLVRRRRSGEGGGFMIGPTDREGVAGMSFADASAYINSLSGQY